MKKERARDENARTFRRIVGENYCDKRTFQECFGHRLWTTRVACPSPKKRMAFGRYRFYGIFLRTCNYFISRRVYKNFTAQRENVLTKQNYWPQGHFIGRAKTWICSPNFYIFKRTVRYNVTMVRIRSLEYGVGYLNFFFPVATSSWAVLRPCSLLLHLREKKVKVKTKRKAKSLSPEFPNLVQQKATATNQEKWKQKTMN